MKSDDFIRTENPSIQLHSRFNFRPLPFLKNRLEDFLNSQLTEMALKKRSTADLWKAATAAGNAIEEQDRQSEARSLQAKVSVLPLHKIIDRANGTRELNTQHVEDLMISMSVLGLLEPIVVDIRGRLLAGGHRRAAIHLLKKRMPLKYAEHFYEELVSVKMLNFDAELDSDLALQVEIAENEKRRDYTPAEVRKLAERLKVAGYSDNKGRPATGSKPLRPALRVIIGKNIRTVQRYLNEPEEKSQTNVRLFPDATALTSLKSHLIKWQKAYGGSEDEIVQSIDRDITKLLKRLDTGIKKSLSPAIESIPVNVTTPHGATTYAQMAVPENPRAENGNAGIIEIAVTSSSLVDRHETMHELQDTLEPISEEIEEEAIDVKIRRKPMKYSIQEISEMTRRPRQAIERMRDKGTLEAIGWRAEKQEDRWWYFSATWGDNAPPVSN